MQYLRARLYDLEAGRFTRLDPFVGNTLVPQSFHKYVYVGADPINDADPSGNVGSAVLRKIIGKLVKNKKVRAGIYATAYAIAKALIGTRATYTLGNAYIRETGRNPADVRINHAIARLADPDLPIDKTAEDFVEQMKEWKVRPDIVDHTAGDQQFYEIKSVGATAAGMTEVAAYDLLLQARYPTLTYARGLWQPSQTVYHIDFAYGIPVPLQIQAWNHAPGLIVYRTAGIEDLVLKAIIATEVSAEIAMQGIKFMAASGATANGGRLQGAWATTLLVSTMVGF